MRTRWTDIRANRKPHELCIAAFGKQILIALLLSSEMPSLREEQWQNCAAAAEMEMAKSGGSDEMSAANDSFQRIQPVDSQDHNRLAVFKNFQNRECGQRLKAVKAVQSTHIDPRPAIN